MSALLFVALCFVCFRVWRFIGKDDITQPARDLLAKETAGAVRRYLLMLVECPYCGGTWISLATTYLTDRWFTHLEPHWLFWGVAVAGAVGLIASNLDDD